VYFKNLFRNKNVFLLTMILREHVVTQLLRHKVTGQKVVGSRPDEVLGFYQLTYSFCLQQVLDFPQPLTEMSTRNRNKNVSCE
jgi:hypothetical protein